MKRFNFWNQTLIVLVFATLLIASCDTEDSADVNQDKIYTDYELFYNSNTDKTQVIARFRFGGPLGTLLELKDPATVKFDGEVMSFKAAFSGHVKEFSGLVEAGTFLYKNVDGESFENTVPAFDAIAFPEGIDSISKSQAFTLTWNGTSLAKDQAVGLFIGSWAWGQDALFVEAGIGKENIVLGANKLANVQAGNTTFYLDRQTEIQVSQGTGEGGLIRGKYRAPNIQVIVK